MTCVVSGGPSGAVNSPNCTIPSPISVMSSPVTTTLTLNTATDNLPGLLHRDCHPWLPRESQCDHKLRRQCAAGADGSSRFHAE